MKVVLINSKAWKKKSHFLLNKIKLFAFFYPNQGVYDKGYPNPTHLSKIILKKLFKPYFNGEKNHNVFLHIK
jgi:hypothetical protein